MRNRKLGDGLTEAGSVLGGYVERDIENLAFGMLAVGRYNSIVGKITCFDEF